MIAIFYDGNGVRGWKEIESENEPYSFLLPYDLVPTLPDVIKNASGNVKIIRNGSGNYAAVAIPAPPPSTEQEVSDLKQRISDLEVMTTYLMGG
jgi:hypothetical protein